LDKSFDNDFWSLWDRGLERRINKNKIETREDNKGINVTYDVPGYDKKSIDISVENNILNIQGNIKGREFKNN
jgi:HSP20 family molecular chaperone IbpA